MSSEGTAEEAIEQLKREVTSLLEELKKKAASLSLLDELSTLDKISAELPSLQSREKLEEVLNTLKEIAARIEQAESRREPRAETAPHIEELVSELEAGAVEAERVSIEELERSVTEALREFRVAERLPEIPRTPAVVSPEGIRRIVKELMDEVAESITRVVRAEIRALLRRLDERLSALEKAVRELRAVTHVVKEERAPRVEERREEVRPAREETRTEGETVEKLLSDAEVLLSKLVPEGLMDLVEFAIQLEACKYRIRELIEKVSLGQVSVPSDTFNKLREVYERLRARAEEVKRIVERRLPVT